MDPADAMHQAAQRYRRDREAATMRSRRIPAGVPWVAPALVVLLALSIYPLIFAVKVALTNGAGAFAFDNFTRLAQDRVFAAAALQTVVFTAVALAVEFVLGLALALLVDSLSRARSCFRAGIMVPMLLPPVVAAVVVAADLQSAVRRLERDAAALWREHCRAHLDQRRSDRRCCP